MGLSKVLHRPYPWPMHDFRTPILLAFATLTFFGTENAARAQTQPGGAAAAPPSTGSAQETQARGYWTDPSTGFMWAAKDNGKQVNWHKAMKYCGTLLLTGHSDWRLPAINELQAIYDGSGFATPTPKGVTWALAGRAKGGLLLTGVREWSSSRKLDDRGHVTGYAWQFDFPHGQRWGYDPLGYSGSLRALCVRGSGK
jgi:hypothetical protein